MKSIEIIVHVYAVKYDNFAYSFAYLLSSLELCPPIKCEVLVTVCCVKDDILTHEVMQFFCDKTKVKIKIITLTDKEMSRRSIGRNIAAKESTGDIIWFCDADYFFGDNCLNTLSNLDWANDITIIYPKNILSSGSFKLGNETNNKMKKCIRILDINKDDYVYQIITRAIGGLQIVKGDFARKHGYLDKHKRWSKATRTILENTREDVPFRLFCTRHGRKMRVRIPNLFRIRHTDSCLINHNPDKLE